MPEIGAESASMNCWHSQGAHGDSRMNYWVVCFLGTESFLHSSEFMVLLPQSPGCWDYRCTELYTACKGSLDMPQMSGLLQFWCIGTLALFLYFYILVSTLCLPKVSG